MTETISSERLYHAILNGAYRTKEKRDDLNRINVFPVVDNDTGNNLAHTMHYIMRHAKPHGNVRATLQDIARSALIGARGNSGAIFSQYFNGLYQSSAEASAVTLAELATCFHEAYIKAYKALETPVEGTVITLMRAWSVSFRESLEQRKPLREHFENSLARISLALDETKTTLKELKKLGVVDAGALGFYYFMDGFVQAVLGQPAALPVQSEMPDLATLDEDIHEFSEGAEIPQRYCTEVLFEADALDHEDFRQALRPLGDCLLISAADNLVRVHLHTNEPWQVIKLAAARGKILEQKADDMVLQNLLAGPAESKIACITDSIADLPRDFVFAHKIFQMPVNIMIDGVSYLDKLTIDNEYLNQHLATASSAQLNTAQIHAYFKPILKHFDQVLVLTVSSQMSGTYSRFKEALAELDLPDGKVVLIDTKVNSGAQGLLVREAASMIEAGLPLAKIAETIEALKSKARIVVSVADIEPMARSGRVSERIGNLLIKLKFKPLITIDREGKGTIKGVAFSLEKNRKIMLKSLRNQAIGDYVIVHANAAERAETLKNDMVRLTGRPPVYTTSISTVVTLFAGQGSVAVAYLEKS